MTGLLLLLFAFGIVMAMYETLSPLQEGWRAFNLEHPLDTLSFFTYVRFVMKGTENQAKWLAARDAERHCSQVTETMEDSFALHHRLRNQYMSELEVTGALRDSLQAVARFDPLVFRVLLPAASDDEAKAAHKRLVALMHRALEELLAEGVQLMHRNNTIVEAAAALQDLRLVVLKGTGNSDGNVGTIRRRMSTAQRTAATGLMQAVQAHHTNGPARMPARM